MGRFTGLNSLLPAKQHGRGSARTIIHTPHDALPPPTPRDLRLGGLDLAARGGLFALLRIERLDLPLRLVGRVLEDGRVAEAGRERDATRELGRGLRDGAVVC